MRNNKEEVRRYWRWESRPGVSVWGLELLLELQDLLDLTWCYIVTGTLDNLEYPPISSSLLVHSWNTWTNMCPELSDFDSLDPLFLLIRAWLSIVCSSNTSLDCKCCITPQSSQGFQNIYLCTCHHYLIWTSLALNQFASQPWLCICIPWSAWVSHPWHQQKCPSSASYCKDKGLHVMKNTKILSISAILQPSNHLLTAQIKSKNLRNILPIYSTHSFLILLSIYEVTTIITLTITDATLIYTPGTGLFPDHVPTGLGTRKHLGITV